MPFLLFSISSGEIIMIMMFILIFFGSKRIPEFARTFGRTIRQIKQASDQVKRDIEGSVNEARKDINENSRKFRKMVEDVEQEESPKKRYKNMGGEELED